VGTTTGGRGTGEAPGDAAILETTGEASPAREPAADKGRT